MVERHTVFGDSFALDKEVYFLLKQAIALHFAVPIPNVVMVGSGKLPGSASRPKIFGLLGSSQISI